jgi:hypothetical protein
MSSERLSLLSLSGALVLELENDILSRYCHITQISQSPQNHIGKVPHRIQISTSRRPAPQAH